MTKSGRDDLQIEQKSQKGGGFSRFLSIIYVLVVLGFFAMAIVLDTFPAKYLMAVGAVVALISIFIVPVLYSKNGKKSRKIISGVLGVIIIGVMGLGIDYMAGTLSLLDKITQISAPKEYFDVIIRTEDTTASVNELEGKQVGTYLTKSYSYSDAKNTLSEQVNVEFVYEDTANTALDNLLEQNYDAVLIEKARYEGLTGADENLASSTKVLYTIEISVKPVDNTTDVNVTKEPFNVFISGLDTSGDISVVSRSDVNIIATVNPNTKKILLTSIPRDYYVNLNKFGENDKLTHSGLYGIQETIATVEGFMNVDINYYLKVNYTTVVELVDAIGGIDIDSPNEFVTSGMGPLNGYYFAEGANHLDGSMALAYSRERKSFVTGDLQRNENQQIVLKAIMKKMLSSKTIITKYTSILDALKNNMETNMGTKDMSKLAKFQLSDMPEWSIETQAIKGDPGNELCYSLGYYASVVLRSETDEAKAYDKIIQVMEG